VLGVVVLGVGAFATYWVISHRTPPEPPPCDDHAEWFDHQERQQLDEITVEFTNPIPLPNIDSLAQLSDTDLGEGQGEAL
jgi:hypothetical protein